MSTISLKTIEKGITDRLNGMLAREKAMQSFLNKNIVELYRNVQRARWMTENSTEGQTWTALNPNYKKWKLVRFAQFEGGGQLMLIATGKLYKSVIGPGAGFRKVVTPRSLIISTNVDYAKHVDEGGKHVVARPFTKYSEESKKLFRKAIAGFLFRGTITQMTRMGRT